MKYLSVALPIPVFKPFYYCTDEELEVGSRVKVPFGKKLSVGYVVQSTDDIPDVSYKIKKISEVIDSKCLISSNLMHLAREMSDYYISSPGEILSAILPVSLRMSKRKGIKEQPELDGYPDYTLSNDQKKVIYPIIKKAKENKFARFLLHGVTDSGKTEVYMRVISEIICLKKQVIMLVPEIAITSQLKDMFMRRFGPERVGIWHSRITSVQKMNYIEKMISGELHVLIGPRSAVFAPFKNLGAIIIDEEQDPTYKNHSAPYYDARWVADRRARMEHAVLVHGTATPGIETLYRTDKGELEYLKITERIHQPEPPGIIIVDMKRERYRSAIFSQYLLNELESVYNKKRQSLLFLNRRGYSPYVICKDCGENIKCPKCNTAFVYHSGLERLVCHMCENKTNIPTNCSSCGGSVFKYLGIGTERVENALKKIFPEIKIVRMDFDTTLKKNSVDMMFKDFKNGKYDIMIGTQIAAKGWDFSNVDLVGVINSDIGLMMPDFRAVEKNFALLKQVEGRTGRGENKGKVVIQTSNPNHYCIKMLFEKDYRKFYDKEIEIRKSTEFPPFSKLINIVCYHKNEKTASANVDFIKKQIESSISNISVFGPVPAVIYKVRGMFRWQLLIRYHKENGVKEKIKDIITSRKFSGRIKVDVDPQEML